jgi:hypothetical protein
MLANVADRALDATFLVTAGHCDGPHFEAVVCGEVDKHGVETNDFALALQNRALQIVVEQHSRHAIPRAESIDVAAEDEGHRRTEEEAQEQLARVAQHHDEGPEHANRLADGKLAK